MKRFYLFLMLLALAAWLGCDKADNPVSPVENQAQPEALEKRHQQMAEAKPKFEASLAAARAKMAQLKALQRLQKTNSSGPAASAGATIRVPNDYPSIQAAVDAAAPGTKILVKAGTYSEEVLIATPNLRLTAAGAVTIAGAFCVSATSGVKIDDFNFTDADFGVIVEASSGVAVKDNAFSNHAFGVALENSSNCTVKNNNFSGIDVGAFAGGGGDHSFNENTATRCFVAFLLEGTKGNTISDNSANSNFDTGIYLTEADNNMIEDNVCNSNRFGIYLNFCSGNTVGSDNTASSNADTGIFLDMDTSGNTVKKNTARRNGSCDIVNEGAGNRFSKNKAGCTSGF